MSTDLRWSADAVAQLTAARRPTASDFRATLASFDRLHHESGADRRLTTEQTTIARAVLAMLLRAARRSERQPRRRDLIDAIHTPRYRRWSRSRAVTTAPAQRHAVRPGRSGTTRPAPRTAGRRASCGNGNGGSSSSGRTPGDPDPAPSGVHGTRRPAVLTVPRPTAPNRAIEGSAR
ncbi:hypothetical protein SK069_09740 [Patulibacter brassicae]|uniref:Uncharacterized protein n=1 Tax=Patulibacter brassicae TaxID=1705717 RepID=A0ABU4VJK1_9ACTN|nr:hypothetical protein [Patulibacter brassicae]MDX8151874.1 hypothetical protein [Patulibacter brassicae]